VKAKPLYPEYDINTYISKVNGFKLQAKYAQNTVFVSSLRGIQRVCRQAQPRRALAFTRYCQYQYCMVYGIQKGGRGGGRRILRKKTCIGIAIVRVNPNRYPPPPLPLSLSPAFSHSLSPHPPSRSRTLPDSPPLSLQPPSRLLNWCPRPSLSHSLSLCLSRQLTPHPLFTPLRAHRAS